MSDFLASREMGDLVIDMPIDFRSLTDACENIKNSAYVESGEIISSTFDRLRFVGEGIYDLDEALSIFGRMYKRFETSSESRMDLRIQIPQIIFLEFREQIQTLCPEIEICVYPEVNPEILNLTIAQNSPERALDPENIQTIQNFIREKAREKLGLIGDFESFALRLLDEFQKENLNFETENFDWRELYELWHEPFGISEEECLQYEAEPSTNAYQIYGIRDEDGRLIAASMIYEGESTEWIVHPDFQGQGLMIPLLIFMNCHHIRNNPENPLFAHLFWRMSVSAGVKSGWKIDIPEEGDERCNVLTNAVSIAHRKLAREEWNRGLSVFGSGENAVAGEDLQSFVVASLDYEKFTPTVLSAYLNHNHSTNE